MVNNYPGDDRLGLLCPGRPAQTGRCSWRLSISRASPNALSKHCNLQRALADRCNTHNFNSPASRAWYSRSDYWTTRCSCLVSLFLLIVLFSTSRATALLMLKMDLRRLAALSLGDCCLGTIALTYFHRDLPQLNDAERDTLVNTELNLNEETTVPWNDIWCVRTFKWRVLPRQPTQSHDDRLLATVTKEL